MHIIDIYSDSARRQDHGEQSKPYIAASIVVLK